MIEFSSVWDGYDCDLFLSEFEVITGMTDIYLSVCRHDYDLDTNTCLRYYDYSLSPLKWVMARNKFLNDGGDLFSILTRTKLDYVFNYVNCKSVLCFQLRYAFNYVNCKALYTDRNPLNSTTRI